MCEPTTIALAIGAGASLVGTATSIAGGVMAGAAEERAARQEAAMLRQRASAAKQLGAEQAAQIRHEGRQIEGAGLAQAAASGVETTTGSVANVFKASQMNVAADAETVRYNTALEAWGLTSQARQREYQGYSARRASILGAVGAGFGGVAQAGGMLAQAFGD